MIDVVSMAHDTGLQWLDGLLTSVSIFKGEYLFHVFVSLMNIVLQNRFSSQKKKKTSIEQQMLRKKSPQKK